MRCAAAPGGSRSPRPGSRQGRPGEAEAHGLHVPAPPAPRRAPPRAPPAARPADPAASGPGPGGAWGRGWKAALQDPGDAGTPACPLALSPAFPATRRDKNRWANFQKPRKAWERRESS